MKKNIYFYKLFIHLQMNKYIYEFSYWLFIGIALYGIGSLDTMGSIILDLYYIDYENA